MRHFDHAYNLGPRKISSKKWIIRMCEEMTNLDDEHQCTIMHKNMGEQITYHFTLVVFIMFSIKVENEGID